MHTKHFNALHVKKGAAPFHPHFTLTLSFTWEQELCWCSCVRWSSLHYYLLKVQFFLHEIALALRCCPQNFISSELFWAWMYFITNNLIPMKWSMLCIHVYKYKYCYQQNYHSYSRKRSMKLIRKQSRIRESGFDEDRMKGFIEKMNTILRNG